MVDKDYHIAFGRHSLIPECCIRFFVDIWDPYSLWRQDTPLVQAVKASSARYVQCPTCLRDKCEPVKIRRCTIDCGRECWKEYR